MATPFDSIYLSSCVLLDDLRKTGPRPLKADEIFGAFVLLASYNITLEDDEQGRIMATVTPDDEPETKPESAKPEE